jgi:DNA-binding winged helix-turn-helix (wHTH) protein/class 3 adenylate cyclase/tetratricopeptide (TPR) repeat protein
MRYTFGAYLLDTACYELYHAGTRVPLRPKALEVLAYLVVHHDRVVSKQELLAQLWPDQVVGEDGLKVYIMAVRQALGERGSAPRLLQTVRGRGYRVVAPVTMADAPSVHLPPSSPLLASVQGHAEPVAVPGCSPALLATASVVPSAPAPLPLSAERKVVTVLVCALAETTTPAESPEPEALHGLRHAVLAQAVDVVQQYGGTLQRLLDDGCMALFGAPVAHEDHALRAILAATRLHQQLRTAAAGAEPCHGQGLTVRIGVHTGPIVVGPVRDPQMLLVTAVGETLQRALDLQHLASPGTTLLSESTLQRVRDAVDVADWHPPSRPTTTTIPVAYEVLTVRPQRPALEARGERVLHRFVGRQHALTMLQTLWTQVERGRGQVVRVVGHPGIGKSRLLYEFRQRLSTTRVTYLYGRCVSYGDATPYLPLRTLLQRAWQITAADSPEAIAAKVHQHLQALGMTPEDAAPSVLLLLGGAVPTHLLTAHSPQVVRARTLETFVQICLHNSRQGPLLLEVEDLHWVDASSHACLAALVDRLAGVPILLLVTARPGYQPCWMDKSYATQIVLQPLSAPESQTVFQTALGTTAQPQALVHAIVQKAEGNPFFLEEFARVVVEHGSQSSALAVPETVQAVLAARIDRLPPETKRLLQLAAVIGREVALPLLQAVAALPAEALHLHLGQLQAAEFLSETQRVPAVAYTFQHALTQEVAYASLVQRIRQQMHGQIGQVLEAQFPAVVQAQPELLAHHALRAEMWDTAVTYCQQAGENALARSAYPEAMAAFEQALGALQHLPESRAMGELAIDLRLAMDEALWRLGDWGRVPASLRDAEALAERLDDQRRLAHVSSEMADGYRILSDYEPALRAGQRALTLAIALGDHALQVEARLQLGLIAYHRGDYGRAIAALRQTLTPLAHHSHRKRHDRPDAPVVWPRSWFLVCLAQVGAFAEGHTMSQDVLRLAEALEHPFSLAVAAFGVGRLSLSQGDLAQAIPVFERGLAVCQTHDLRDWIPDFAASVGYAYALVGRLSEAVPLLERAIRQYAAMRGGAPDPSFDVWLGEAYRLAGRLDEAWTQAQRALECSRAHQEGGNEAYALRLLGDIAAHRSPPDVDQAAVHYRQALALAEALGMRPLQAHCHRGLGTLYAATDQREQACAELAAAMEMYRAMEMTFWLPETEAALAQVEEH